MNKCSICERRECDKRSSICATCRDNDIYTSHFKIAPQAQAILDSLGIEMDELKEEPSLPQDSSNPNR